MSKTSIGLIFGLTLIAALTALIPSQQPRNIQIGTNFYFWESSTARDWDQALEHCKQEDGELAKIINPTVYNALRLSLPVEGSYWIDGKDIENKDRFTHNTECSAGALNFDGIPNLEFPHLTCLTLVKGSNAANSRIEAKSCFPAEIGVICSFPFAAGRCPARKFNVSNY